VKKKIQIGTCIIVLCQFLPVGIPLRAQTADSSKSIVFSSPKNTIEPIPQKARFGAIASLSFGTYNGFRSDGYYASFLQPNIGLEFLAEPIGGLHLLFGGHIGISNPVTTGVSFSYRAPLDISKNPDLKVFADLGILFFDDQTFAAPIKYGARLAFGARTFGGIDMEYRLAGEWRGSGSDSIDGSRSRTLWWVGAEVGIAFSLIKESKAFFSRKDSLHASLRYITTGAEIDELDQITSDARMDEWVDRFWRARDLTPEKKINDVRTEYEKRVEEANRLFSTPNRLGISTDPGRVIAIYGIPDVEDKDRSVTSDQVHYMIFVYKGRVKDVTFATFLFQTTSERMNWEQIYSNVPGEMSGSIQNDLPTRMYKWIGL